MLNKYFDMSGDYTKNTIGSSLQCSHQIILVQCLKLDSLIMKVDNCCLLFNCYRLKLERLLLLNFRIVSHTTKNLHNI